MAKILLVEDDLLLQNSLKVFLQRQNFTVEAIASGDEALARLRTEQYDVIIIDWGLPDTSGIDVCRQYRDNKGMIPILMLTGKSETIHKASGLDAGADDYLTKPFENLELMARLRALMRRQPVVQASVLRLGNVEIDRTNSTVTIAGRNCAFFPKEYSLLEFLMRNPNHPFPADVLLERVWSSESEVTADTIRAYITKIRSKLQSEEATIAITTRKGYGYLLEES